MRRRHEVTEAELEDYMKSRWIEFAGSFGENSNKKLEFNAAGLYRVTDHGRMIYIGALKETAVREYNSLP